MSQNTPHTPASIRFCRRAPVHYLCYGCGDSVPCLYISIRATDDDSPPPRTCPLNPAERRCHFELEDEEELHLIDWFSNQRIAQDAWDLEHS